MPASRTHLDVLQIVEPCPMDWNAMSGDRQSRYCSQCGKNVHNLSEMNQSEAERLLCEKAGNLCVRFERARDGRIITLDYRRPTQNKTWRYWTGVGLITSALGAIGYALAPTRSMGVMTTGPALMSTTSPTPATNPSTVCPTPTTAPAPDDPATPN